MIKYAALLKLYGLMQLSNLKVLVAYDVHLGTTNFLKLKCCCQQKEKLYGPVVYQQNKS